MFKKTLAVAVAVTAMGAQALDAPIVGNVESKCMVSKQLRQGHCRH